MYLLSLHLSEHVIVVCTYCVPGVCTHCVHGRVCVDSFGWGQWPGPAQLNRHRQFVDNRQRRYIILC